MDRRTSWRIGSLLLVAALVLLAILSLAVQGGRHAEASGAVRAIDGDSLQIGARVFHLHGIDAPELGQACINHARLERCGLEAAFILQKHLALQPEPPVCFREYGATDTGEVVATCAVGDEDLALVMLRDGLAVATADAPEAYRFAAEGAATAGLGLWHDRFTPPALWRAEGAPEEALSPCPVLTRTGRDGAHLYVVPTDENYADLRTAALANGTPTFCSDEAARAAGFRRHREQAASRR